MKKEKSKYRVDIFERYNDNIVNKISLNKNTRPNINDYRGYFSPKLSSCFSIQFYELENKHYKKIECWCKTKKGWKQY